ncbi:MAG: prolyl-tRNA synthetase associated domain-containing protein [Christensenellales bacterium]
MNDTAREVIQKLGEMGISHALFAHPPAQTMADCRAAEVALNAVMPKNIFLCPRNQSSYFLLIARPNARFRTAEVSKQLGVSRLSFAPADKLWDYLKIRPGAISPMGLLFDEARAVTLAIDAALRDVPMLAFHPCDNTSSLSISNEDFFMNFLPMLGYSPAFVEMRDQDDD